MFVKETTKENLRHEPKLRLGLKHTQEWARGRDSGNSYNMYVLSLLHWPWCTHVQRQGSENTLGVSRPDRSALHHATWRSKHRDTGQTHTTHRESEGIQDLLGDTVTGKLDL